ncbi:MAG: PAS domain S-box protein, partial [Deltaproteobacteria bacterium]|nr:PAS domain S-box protein [Deltaproteobacteria bacterium]
MAGRDDGNHASDLAALAGMDWRALFDAIAHPTLILSPDQVVLAANGAVTERLGCAEGDLLGKRCWEVFHSPEHRGPSSECIMAEAVAGPATPQGATAEVELERLGGHFRVSCVALHDQQEQLSHVVHMATDVSDRRRSELAAMESERLFRTLFDQAGDYILLVDPAHPDGPVIIDANQSACDKHGYTREELLGMQMIELDAPETRKLVPENARRLIAGEDLVFETVHVRKDGSLFPVEVSAKLIHIGGKPRIFAIERDISERKQAEEERERLQAQLLQAQKLESLGVLTGGIAHDFNNLLMGMVGNADLLLKNLPVGDPMRRRVEGINTAARQAKDLVRQMLSYAGGERFEVVPIDVHELVEEMVSLLEAALPKAVTLELCTETRVPAVEADPGQIRQVVMNVITNASEALGEQGGTISIRVGAKEYDAATLEQTYLDEELPGGRYVFVEVVDEGAGMDPHTLDRIFDPFFTTKFEGRGLGLAAVLGIVRSHHGALAIASEPGVGTTFT